MISPKNAKTALLSSEKAAAGNSSSGNMQYLTSSKEKVDQEEDLYNVQDDL